ncbi:MAG: DNA repair protein RecO [Eggerthellaceae bacterium]|nr:DNA repair protein RecO [Eggerthellaceae bacterium]
MAEQTYQTDIIVLKKTKLKETDLIIEALSDTGSLVKFVAKGARKPGSSFSSRLELGAYANALCVHGKNLDICKEARLVNAHALLRNDVDRSLSMQCILEILSKTALSKLDNPKVFAMSVSVLDALDDCEKSALGFLVSAFYLKLFAFLGIKPALDSCASCGHDIDKSNDESPHAHVAFSYENGGVLCRVCAANADALLIDANLISWMNWLLNSTFADICAHLPEETIASSVLGICKRWVSVHIQTNLKSLDFLIGDKYR